MTACLNNTGVIACMRGAGGAIEWRLVEMVSQEETVRVKKAGMLLRYIGISVLCACALLSEACAKPAVHRAVPMDTIPSATASQPTDRRVLVGEWEYVDGAAIRLALDEQGNSRYAPRSYLAWQVVSEGK